MTNKKLFIVLNYAMISSWILTGCSGDTTGPDQLNDQGVHNVPQLIQSGKTTKLEVIKSFGHPAKTTSLGAGQEVWDYYFTHSGLTTSTRVLSFIFPVTSVVMERSVNVKDRMLRIVFEGQIAKQYKVIEKKYTKTVNPVGVKTKSNF